MLGPYGSARPFCCSWDARSHDLLAIAVVVVVFFFFQAEDGIRDYKVTGVQTCALPILMLMRYGWPRRGQKAVVAAEVMVMPRSCSCSIQSMVAVPSCTSPSLYVRPV